MVVEVLEGYKDKFLSRLDEVTMDEEVGVECSDIQIVLLGRKRLFEKVVSVVATIEICK